MNLFIRWIFYSLAIIFTAWLLPGISVENFVAALFVVFLLALANTVVKPILMVVTLPLNLLTLGLFTFIINALLFWFVGAIAPGFEVDGFLNALLGALIMSLFSAFINNIGKDEI